MKSTISCQTTSVIEDEMEERRKKKMGPNGWNTMGTLSMHSENVIARTAVHPSGRRHLVWCCPIMSCYYDAIELRSKLKRIPTHIGWQRSDTLWDNKTYIFSLRQPNFHWFTIQNNNTLHINFSHVLIELCHLRSAMKEVNDWALVVFYYNGGKSFRILNCGGLLS